MWCIISKWVPGIRGTYHLTYSINNLSENLVSWSGVSAVKREEGGGGGKEGEGEEEEEGGGVEEEEENQKLPRRLLAHFGVKHHPHSPVVPRRLPASVTRETATSSLPTNPRLRNPLAWSHPGLGLARVRIDVRYRPMSVSG
ncbi:hypothetical protein SK128_006973 [Halocaridina rubra]|uniref:Uncharacterized protein n=1 Tax=Halocaridina rubra TaxID=373956 RepID=A0AAN8X1Q7_HALRR